jgi:hypothetical protein
MSQKLIPVAGFDQTLFPFVDIFFTSRLSALRGYLSNKLLDLFSLL